MSEMMVGQESAFQQGYRQGRDDNDKKYLAFLSRYDKLLEFVKYISRGVKIEDLTFKAEDLLKGIGEAP